MPDSCETVGAERGFESPAPWAVDPWAPELSGLSSVLAVGAVAPEVGLVSNPSSGASVSGFLMIVELAGPCSALASAESADADADDAVAPLVADAVALWDDGEVEDGFDAEPSDAEPDSDALVEDACEGSAHATAFSVTASPRPSATANPPTRPTNAAAPIVSFPSSASRPIGTLVTKTRYVLLFHRTAIAGAEVPKSLVAVRRGDRPRCGAQPCLPGERRRGFGCEHDALGSVAY